MSRLFRHALAVACLLAAPGCTDGIDSTYGRMAGADGGDSVNGTGVLAAMFEQAGARVSRVSWLSPKVAEEADTIVWAPDDFQAPAEEVIDWMDDWLFAEPGRTLVYIGRDYDAAPAYWRAVAGSAPAGQMPEIKRRLGGAGRQFYERRREHPEDQANEWFTIKPRARHRRVRSLAGPFSGGIDPKKLGVELFGRLVPAGGSELLASGRDALISRLPIHGGQLILVVNGSLLLNLPLVNHEHRKLAAKLIQATGKGDVVFLESGPGGPELLEKEPPIAMRNGLEFLTVAPFDKIFLQLAVLGLVFCVARFPIFGQPRELDNAGHSDFARHVSALGQLLDRTSDRKHAIERIEQYRQSVRREPGRFKRAEPA